MKNGQSNNCNMTPCMFVSKSDSQRYEIWNYRYQNKTSAQISGDS